MSLEEKDCRCWKQVANDSHHPFILVKAMLCGSSWCKDYIGEATFKKLFGAEDEH